MELKFDTSKTYAIALEGGGARGAYHIGVWKAFDEAGIKYKAVSGTSVGALNGALLAMGDLGRAVKIWQNISISNVISTDVLDENELKKLIFGEFGKTNMREMLPKLGDILKNRGLDITPLRKWIKDAVDVEKIKNSGIELFVSTLSLSDKKGLEIKINDLPDNEVCDMLLASAYHPTFKLEKLNGKYYLDGGLVDSIPIHALIKSGYKDIFAVRLPSSGIEKLIRIPKGTTVTTIRTSYDLGGSLTFDAEISKRNLIIGYMDAKRVLYGLHGRKYYIEQTLSDRDALNWLIDYNLKNDPASSLRLICEHTLPSMANILNVRYGNYFELMTAVLEREAESLGIYPFEIRTDVSFIDEVAKAQKKHFNT